MLPTISEENYLKSIFSYKDFYGEDIGVSQLARKLNVSNAAISDMAKKLSKKGFIRYEKYKTLKLTEAGNGFALQVLRKHRLWELFLVNVLHLDLDDLHEEAEVLEHHTSDLLIDKIDELLGHPSFDPHGHPIPDKNGNMPEVPDLIPLAQGSENKTYQVVQINDEDKSLIRYLTQIDLVVNRKFQIVGKLDYDKSILIRLHNNTISVSEKISENIFIRPEKP